jgi:glycosyltransferase involved in cell wall biosynthesis
MARIGIDARLYGVVSGTGIGRYAEEFIHALAKVDQENEYVVFLQRDALRFFLLPNERWEKQLADFRPYSLAAQLHFPSIIAKAKVDLMHFTHFDHPMRSRTPFCITIHDLILLQHPTTRASLLGPVRFWIKYIAYRIVLRHAVQKSTCILTPSQSVATQIMQQCHVPEQRVVATLLGIDHLDSKTPQRGTPPGIQPPQSPYLLYIGNAYPHKQLDLLIEHVQAARVHDDLNNLQLMIVGREDDFVRQIHTALHDEAPTSNRLCAQHPGIIFAGPVDDATLRGLMGNAIAYVTCSADEGFDLPALEALAAGTATIASDIPVHREILGNHVHYFDPHRHNSFLKVVRRTLQNPIPHRGTLQASAAAHVRSFTWKRCALRTLAVYRDTLERMMHCN